MQEVRFGIIGVGIQGSKYLGFFVNRELKNGKLVALCDRDPHVLSKFQAQYGDLFRYYSDSDSLLADPEIDAVFVTTPHYDHVPISIAALKAGKHLICDKPIGVYTKNVGELLKTAEISDRVFSMMHNQRTNPVFRKIREMIQDGELGGLKRYIWICTDWYRSQAYYNLGGWRATWLGEGGGMLINQCPHNMDLLQWIFGMPKRLWAKSICGKYHQIEVEDDATVYLEYEKDFTGMLLASTGESPGTNRLEVSGDLGRLVYEGGDSFFFDENTVAEPEFSRHEAEHHGTGFDRPPCYRRVIQPQGEETAHKGIIQNVINAILNGEELIAPGPEGINALALINGVNLSTWTDSIIDFPIDADLYWKLLQEKIQASSIKSV